VQRYPKAKILFSGGGQEESKSKFREADVAKQVIDLLGILPERTLYERESLNTFENAKFSYELVQPKANDLWLLVTSAVHIPRAIAVFRKVGWNVQAAPGGFLTPKLMPPQSVPNVLWQLDKASAALHEYIGLVYYYAKGRTVELWPSR
jgi:uncharacterized SAM-binding protein YcdF (DUF218 family)